MTISIINGKVHQFIDDGYRQIGGENLENTGDSGTDAEDGHYR